MNGFEVLEHAADLGFLAYGATREDTLEQAVAALLSIAVDPDAIAERGHLDAQVSGDDLNGLLVNVLEEVLFLFDSNAFAPSRAEVTLATDSTARIRLFGEPRDPVRHRWRLIVKAITYHRLAFTQDARGWQARVFVDV
ncbi:MAG: archease [Vicinamibacterales bacterium]